MSSNLSPSQNFCASPTCPQTFEVPKLLLCSKCRCVRYCSRECQGEHWKEHKKQCKFTASFLEALSKPEKLRNLKKAQVKNLKSILAILKKDATAGDVLAQVNLALCYEIGIGIIKDEGKAVQYYKMAADQGDAQAQLNLGLCYEMGKGINKDEGKAVQYYKMAADQGNTEAQFNLGLCYHRGTDAIKDERKAAYIVYVRRSL